MFKVGDEVWYEGLKYRISRKEEYGRRGIYDLGDELHMIDGESLKPVTNYHGNITIRGKVHEVDKDGDDSDQVNSPSHYTHGEYEVIDVIEDWKLGFRLANVIKYIARAEHKDNKKQDLEKALFYLKREINQCE